jgi:hypothetical protein
MLVDAAVSWLPKTGGADHMKDSSERLYGPTGQTSKFSKVVSKKALRLSLIWVAISGDGFGYFPWVGSMSRLVW